MKKYLKTPEEVISALKEGKTVYSDCGKYKMIDGFIVFESGGLCVVNAGLMLKENLFVREPEPFKIEVGKFYKTRGGEKARCYCKGEQDSLFTVDGAATIFHVFTDSGRSWKDDNISLYDIIGPWEE